MYNNTLYHHGILGQKWGKRNGPPYPLDSSDHSTAEKKAGWKKSLDNSADTSTSNKRERKDAEKAQKKALKEYKKKYGKEDRIVVRQAMMWTNSNVNRLKLRKKMAEMNSDSITLTTYINRGKTVVDHYFDKYGTALYSDIIDAESGELLRSLHYV